MRILLLSLVVCGFAFSKPVERNVDPYRFVWPKSERDFPGLTRFFVDINDDGKPDLFLGETEFIGQGGGPFEVYLVHGPKNYQHIGKVMIQPSVMKILPSASNGVHDLAGNLRHEAPGEGKTWIYRFNGKAFKKEAGPTDDSIPVSPISEMESTTDRMKWKP